MELAEVYTVANRMQRRDAKDIIREFSKELSEMRGRCIDIGCGPGDVTKEVMLPLLHPDVTVVGADISETMTNYGNQTYAENGRLSFIVLDIEAPELPNNEIESYDFVVSFSCLHWCKDVRRALTNMYKLLRPGGKALIEFISHHDGLEIYDQLKRYPRYEPYLQDARRYVPYFQFCEDRRVSLRQMLDQVGFKVSHCSDREKSYVYSSREMLRKNVLAVNPFVSRMPENMRDKFIDDLMDDIMNNQIVFPCHGRKRQERGEKELQENQGENVLLDRYYIMVAYVKKPRVRSHLLANEESRVCAS